ncbi:hypothetical protein ACN6J9_05935 [Carnobacterium maltaromaticum]|uniref:hypothetical protein n=1 Tax=Carnobacterium maltaromaticum TaxID=2751 RepID=UPI000705039F|nr:hypothetical protein [Carnobacterium maltaromaticum]KRN72989.1 hypothetical protein IV76_GL002095 [Carnobacterium maltaromaticum]MBC9808927.1 hypothetical protein [Carnobacterium maltaromaticum]CRH18590.1 ABC-2 type transporter family protein [Carnobacterium maltaromaticum]CRH20753.1 ABC-2 type transporter family protein [Carnobacterium maltaromaticum]
MEWLRLVKTQFMVEWKTKIGYGMSTISDIMLYVITFFVVMFVYNSNGMVDFYKVDANYSSILLLIGYVFWNVGCISMDMSSQTIESDSKAGIIENEIQSKYSFPLVIWIRSLCVTLFSYIYLFVLILATSFFVGLAPFKVVTLVVNLVMVSFISNIGMFGIGLLFGSVSLRFKRIGQWMIIFQALLLFVSNIAMPMTNMFQMIAPFGLGIELSRNLFMGLNLEIDKIIIYIFINSLWLIIGYLAFNYSILQERKYGSFEQF